MKEFKKGDKVQVGATARTGKMVWQEATVLRISPWGTVKTNRGDYRPRCVRKECK
jgi:hypothetical protein